MASESAELSNEGMRKADADLIGKYCENLQEGWAAFKDYETFLC